MRNTLWILVVVCGIAPDWATIFWCLAILFVYWMLTIIHEIWSWDSPYDTKSKKYKKEEPIKNPEQTLEETKARMNLEYHKKLAKMSAILPAQPNPEEKIVKKN